MARQLFSPSWHSVAELKPRLSPQARVHRHVYRDQVWYVAQDQTGMRFHRMTPAAYALLRAMDGTRHVRDIWLEANRSGTGDACTQSELVDLLARLHDADLLQADVTPDSAALFERYKKKRRAGWLQFLLNPLSLKLPLVDPDAFLARSTPYLAWCFGKLGGALWLAVVLPALVLWLRHWPELTNNLSDRLLASSNLLVMACVFPVVKLLHELGHAYAVRAWGGTVHEMGVMFLVFMPVPYVNASASTAFESKWRRALVAAAGMLTELFIAAVAMFVWVLAEPGLVRAVAYNTMIVAGISTLIVNGNPLLRFDAYFILCDILEMPNLAQRGQKLYAYLWDRHVFGARDADPPRETGRDTTWLLAYTPLAWLYRIALTVSIILFVAGEFFIVGVIIALWGTITLLGIPIWKAARHVLHAPHLRRQRDRAVRLSVALLALAGLAAFALPLPLRTQAEGVVWLPDQAIVRARGDGFFARWLVEPGTNIQRGAAIFQLEDNNLATELRVARARQAVAQARFRADQYSDLARAEVSRRQLREESAILAQLDARAAKLIGYADTGGVLMASSAQDLPGRYLREGSPVGHVLDARSLMARVVVSQGDIDLVRSSFRSAQLRFADWIDEVHETHPVRLPAGGVDRLPSAALGMSGGGSIATLPDGPDGLATLERVFVIDLALPPDTPPTAFGERVFVRFDHGWEPLAWQLGRRVRQLFLSRFNV